MAEIGHAVFEQITAQTSTSSTYVTPSGCEILGTDLVGSSDYLIVFYAIVGGNSTSVNTFQYQILENGVGALSGSHCQQEPDATTSLGGAPYVFMARVTTAATPNDYEFQFEESAGTNTVSVAACRGFAIKLDDITENSDFFWDTDSTLLNALSNAAWTDGASVTIGNGSDNYLILSFAHVLCDSTTVRILHAIDAGGTDYGLMSLEGEDTVEEYCIGSACYLAAPASSTVVKNQFQTESATSGLMDVDENRIFALNLSAFEDATGVYDAGPFDLTSVDTTYNALNHTHTTSTAATRDWFFYAYGASSFITDASGRTTAELYSNNATVAIAGTVNSAASLLAARDPDDDLPTHLFGELASMANATGLDIDLHYEEDVTAGTDVIGMSIVGLTWELAAAEAAQPLAAFYDNPYTIVKSRS